MSQPNDFLEDFLAELPFQADAFQQDAMRVISNGKSVVVSSPTGSGKTLIAEFAAYRALKNGQKIFYTTPLKALSNQKLFDFRKRYGDDAVGLLTGDLSVNRDAQIVVMTTEVFRNMLYGIQEDSRLLQQVSAVILDECHYMNDAQRGTVWEESIIYCPETIQLVALSATIANAYELTDWINEVHHDTYLVETDFRPVPLQHFYYTREAMLPLFDHGTKRINQKLKNDRKGKRLAKHLRAFDSNQLIRTLAERDMLPAIFFTFSRKGCDKYLMETHRLNLLTAAEKTRIETFIQHYLQEHPYLARSKYLAPLRHGFASHHAGLLPALKSLVELLFQQGLIKVVFATETLAAGINMPARTTVITAISKRADEGHRILTASEFLQMSGRAGRRGMDPVGYVVTVSSQFESAFDVAMLAASEANPLESRFTPTYGMVLNLLQKFSLEQVKYLISKSFGSFTATRRLAPLLQTFEAVRAEREELQAFVCPVNLSDADFKAFLRSDEMLAEARQEVKLYQQQLKKFGFSPEMQKALAQAEGKKASLKTTLETSPCQSCELLGKHEKNWSRLAKVEKRYKGLEREVAEQQDWYWRQFENHYQLLRSVGYLDESDRPTRPGEVTRQLRAENEFYLANVLLNHLCDGLTPPQLAGLVCALVNDSTRDNVVTRLTPSEAVRERVRECQGLAKSVYRIQREHRIRTEILLNPIISGIVEAWTDGMAWEQVISQASIDEGDLVRVIRRTADMLRQIARLDQLDSILQDTAKLALEALYRDPVRDAEVVPPEETALPEVVTSPMDGV